MNEDEVDELAREFAGEPDPPGPEFYHADLGCGC